MKNAKKLTDQVKKAIQNTTVGLDKREQVEVIERAMLELSKYRSDLQRKITEDEERFTQIRWGWLHQYLNRK